MQRQEQNVHRPRLIRAKQARRSSFWPVCQRIIAACGLLLALPIFLLLYPLVKLSSPGPFLYRQQRPGLDGKPFTAWKIRSMRPNSDIDPNAARSVRGDDPRVTRIGKVMRDLKLDELPQLWNVIKGDMELVGPRPIALSFQQELEEKIPGFSARLCVKPGLTSLPQVCILESQEQDRVVADWAQRFAAERHYIQHKSAAYDLLILGLTVLYIGRKILSKLIRLAGTFSGFARWSAIVLLSILLITLTACSSHNDKKGFTQKGEVLTRSIAGPSAETEASTGVEIKRVSVKPAANKGPDQAYRIGPGDVLAINIFGEPGMDAIKAAVDSEGMIQLPIIELIKAQGLTVSELQKKLKTLYAKEFVDPWAVVSIESYGSRPLYLLGAFNGPGISYMRGPTNILTALGMGKGVTPNAYLKGARVIRKKQVLPVDVNAVLKEGALDQNIWLKAEDTLFIPSTDDLKAYVLGAVKTPGAVPLGASQMTLARALALAGGPTSPDARLDEVRIIRTITPVKGELILVNAKRILQGKMADFTLQPDDIVYVGQQAFADWNDFVAIIMPTVRVAGLVFSPFLSYDSLTVGK